MLQFPAITTEGVVTGPAGHRWPLAPPLFTVVSEVTFFSTDFWWRMFLLTPFYRPREPLQLLLLIHPLIIPGRSAWPPSLLPGLPHYLYLSSGTKFHMVQQKAAASPNNVSNEKQVRVARPSPDPAEGPPHWPAGRQQATGQLRQCSIFDTPISLRYRIFFFSRVHRI